MPRSMILKNKLNIKLILPLLLLGFSSTYAGCIVVSTNLHLSSKSEKIFLERFPKGAVINFRGVYVYTMGPYDTRRDANIDLPKVKSYYNQAFIAGCTQMMKVKMQMEAVKSSNNVPRDHTEIKTPMVGSVTTAGSSTMTPSKNLAPPIEVRMALKNDSSKSETSDKPDFFNAKTFPMDQNNSSEIKENELVKNKVESLGNTNEQSYHSLLYKDYLIKLMSDNDQAQGIDYQKKIDYLLMEIKKDKYNFDVFVNGYLGTGSYLTNQNISGNTGVVPTINNGSYTGAGASLNANKILYDGDYSLINNSYDVLYKKLADITELNEKDKLIVLGTTIYTNLYTSQEEMKNFETIYQKQLHMEKIISDGYKKDQRTVVDYVDARNDSLSILRVMMELKYQYVNNDYILRQSIKSKDEKTYKLFAYTFGMGNDSLVMLQKEALSHNGDIEKESNNLKITETDLLSQQRRYYPQISFNSYLGYGLSDTKVFSPTAGSTGDYWQVGLNLKMPIYNRDDIRLNKEKSAYAVLKEKTVFSSQQKSILAQVEKSYLQIEKIKRQMDVIDEQLSLLDLKLKISEKRFLSGVSEYKIYSDALKGYLDYKNQMLKLKQEYTQEAVILNILVGRRSFYESN